MAGLRPFPFALLVTRMLRELAERRSIFDLPCAKFFAGAPGLDLAVLCHGRAAATPFGPAAGPHTQLAQNIVLSWLGGGRVLELKTVQDNDAITVPRPCIDMRTVGYNVEWSQELTLPQALEEYVKGAMLIRLLAASGLLPGGAGPHGALFDASAGYDLAGVRGAKMQAFLRALGDASPLIERLRREIPAEFARYRDLDHPPRLAGSLTLSTFHGCPPHQIESIVLHLMEEHGLDCTVKLNPLLLGRERLYELLHGALGYDGIHCPEAAFARDTTWEQATGMVERLSARAAALGRGFGVKFCNTLIVENREGFLPKSEQWMYLSGPPLHVLAIDLVARFRRRFAADVPLSFSAGIDRKNFPEAVALGLVPVTACTDLLKAGGYGRARACLDELLARMRQTGAATIDQFVLRAFGHGQAALDRLPLDPETRQACEQALRAGGDLKAAAGDAVFPRWVREAQVLNTAHYARRVAEDPRYRRAAVAKPPAKIGRSLRLFDCLTCDKCIPVCPNDATFAFVLPRGEIPIVKASYDGARWSTRQEGVLAITEKHQIGTFAGFCNDCGNCDVFCPEDGGPYAIKPRFYSDPADWRADSGRDGFCLERTQGAEVFLGRVHGVEYRLEQDGARLAFSGPGFAVTFRADDPAGTLAGEANVEVDLAWARVLDHVKEAVYGPGALSYAALAARGV